MKTEFRPKRKRILLFSSAPTGGGVSSMTVEMATALHALGHDIEVAFLERSKQFSISLEYAAYEGFRATSLKSFRPVFIGFHTWNWGEVWRKYLGKFDAVVVVCGSPYIAFPFLRSGKPVYVWAAVTLKQDLMGRYERFGLMNKIAYRLWLPQLYKQERVALCECARLWALSQSSMQDFEATAGRELSRSSVLMAPIDTRIFCPPENPTSGHTILFTGRYNDRRKDVATLIKAISIVRRQIAEAKLVLIGESPPLHELSSLVAGLGLDDAVEFLSWVDRTGLVKHYQSARVLAIPSRQEGLCISGLEAMACGLPVVSTQCGGPEAYVQDGKNGFLVPVKDHEAMAKALTYVLSDEEACRSMSIAARKFVLDHCGVDAFKAKVTEVSE